MVKYKTKKEGNKKSSKKILRETKTGKTYTETEETIRKFIILVIVMIIMVIGGYFLSKIVVDNRNSTEQDDTISGEIDYDIASIGTLLNRPYDEYYVMLYNSENPDAIYYSSLITNYQSKDAALKIYYCDLGNFLNSNYVVKDGSANPNAKNIEDLSFGEVTLLKVKDGKITNAYESLEKIKENLQ